MTLEDILRKADTMNSMTIATVGEDGEPQASTIEFCVQGNAILFDSFEASRKVKNIERGSRVALVIMPSETSTVQLQGEALVLTGDERDRAVETYIAKIPRASGWINNDDVKVFSVRLSWARHIDVSTHPWNVYECTLNENTMEM